MKATWVPKPVCKINNITKFWACQLLSTSRGFFIGQTRLVASHSPKINMILGNFTSGMMGLTYNHHSAALGWKRVARYPSNRVRVGCFSWEAEIEIPLLTGPGLWPLKPTPRYEHKLILSGLSPKTQSWLDLTVELIWLVNQMA